MNLTGAQDGMLERTPSLFAGVEPLEVFAELLAGIDTDTTSTVFYDRICEAICRLTTMRRAAIFLADREMRRVHVVGVHGTSFQQLTALQPTLVDTPIAQRALLDDEVVVVSEGVEAMLPPQYARALGISTLVCTPMRLAGRGYGVICADRGGGRFQLTDGERHLLWTLGKVAALVATARTATRQQERSRQLSERLSLAREIHGRVLQRLFGVSAALAAPAPLGAKERERSREELGEAIADLRRALGRPLGAPSRRVPGATAEADAPALTAREGQVLRQIAAGSTNREIAEQLHLSPHTVKEHTSAVYRKLGARNRAEAVTRAQRAGLL